jgi:hypothetical protein
MKEKKKNIKNFTEVLSQRKSQIYHFFEFSTFSIIELIFNKKNPAQKNFNSLYCFVFLIPKKMRYYTKPPPEIV